MSPTKDSSRTGDISFLMEWFAQIQDGDSGTIPYCLEMFPVTKFIDELAFMRSGHTLPTGKIQEKQCCVTFLLKSRGPRHGTGRLAQCKTPVQETSLKLKSPN